ncbi:hypothetical protein J0904_15135, partial [Acinetobacter bereziniae]|uniref:hypothetical protein n=1 Tax=Acinetobacter bereziniae TaxID=106648 RepID=UPI00207549F3
MEWRHSCRFTVESLWVFYQFLRVLNFKSIQKLNAHFNHNPEQEQSTALFAAQGAAGTSVFFVASSFPCETV